MLPLRSLCLSRLRRRRCARWRLQGSESQQPTSDTGSQVIGASRSGHPHTLFLWPPNGDDASFAARAPPPRVRGFGGGEGVQLQRSGAGAFSAVASDVLPALIARWRARLRRAPRRAHTFFVQRAAGGGLAEIEDAAGALERCLATGRRHAGRCEHEEQGRRGERDGCPPRAVADECERGQALYLRGLSSSLITLFVGV